MEPQTITGATRLIGLLGSPVGHSLSPALHNHVFRSLGLPYAYVPLAVDATRLHTALWALRAFSFVGANVTIPHKQAVAPYCDVVSPLSLLSGTINTLYFSNGVLHGTTTDWEGFEKALAAMGHDPAGGYVVILGNGGTARTLAFGFASKNIPSNLVIVGRDETRVSALGREVTEKTGFPIETALFSSSRLAQIMRACTLCVNCTSVGMHPSAGSSVLGADFFRRGMTVLDTVYNPAQTRFLALAEQAGCAWQNGLRMLVFQGLASCRLWTGRTVPDDTIDFKELETLVASNNKRNEPKP
jgi:shikimate dehydrogenase